MYKPRRSRGLLPAENVNSRYILRYLIIFFSLRIIIYLHFANFDTCRKLISIKDFLYFLNPVVRVLPCIKHLKL
jgi:hypothetical protein